MINEPLPIILSTQKLNNVIVKKGNLKKSLSLELTVNW